MEREITIRQRNRRRRRKRRAPLVREEDRPVGDLTKQSTRRFLVVQKINPGPNEDSLMWYQSDNNPLKQAFKKEHKR